MSIKKPYTVTLQDSEGDYYDVICDAVDFDDAERIVLAKYPEDEMIDVVKGVSGMLFKEDLRDR